MEVVFHILSSCVEIRLHAEYQFPRFPTTVLIVMIPNKVWWFLTDYITTIGLN